MAFDEIGKAVGHVFASQFQSLREAFHRFVDLRSRCVLRALGDFARDDCWA